MNTEITSIRNNPLMDRRELSLRINHEGESTPSEDDVKSRIAAENDLSQDNIEVEGIYTGFGSNTSKAELKVYEDFDYDEDLEEDDMEEEIEVEEDYQEIVAGTITEAKNALKEMENPDFRQAIEAEKQNKDRKTLKEWLEAQKE